MKISRIIALALSSLLFALPFALMISAAKDRQAKIAELIEALHTGDEDSREIRVLAEIGQPAVAELFKLLDKKGIDKPNRPGPRGLAAQALGLIRARAAMASDDAASKAIEDRLLQLLHDPSDAVSVASSRALSLNIPRSKRAIPEFVAILKDPNASDWRRSGSWGALRAFGPEAEHVIPELLGCLTNKDYGARQRSQLCTILAAVGPNDARVLAALRTALKNVAEEEVVRGQAANALAKLGKPAEVALSELGQVLEETADKKRGMNGFDLRMSVVSALVRMKLTKNEVEILCEIVADTKDDDRLRIQAAKAIGKSGSVAAFALPSLLKVLKEEHRRVSMPLVFQQILIAIGQMGPAANGAKATLEQMLADENTIRGLKELITNTLRKIAIP